MRYRTAKIFQNLATFINIAETFIFTDVVATGHYIVYVNINTKEGKKWLLVPGLSSHVHHNSFASGF